MPTTIIPESPSPQLKIALRWINAFRESNYETSDLSDDFLQTTVPSSSGLPPFNKDEYVENLLQYRTLFNDDFVQTIEEIIECPGKVFIYMTFDAVSRTGHPINFDISYTYTFHVNPDEKRVQISALRVFLDSQIMMVFLPEEVERLVALEEN